ncbi:hypothetical protein D3C76_819410 [compost metagenome]
MAIAAFDLDHRDAFGSLGLVHVFGGGRLPAVSEQIAVVGVFVVDGHQRPIVIIGEGEQAHAVIVVTELQFLGLGCALAGCIEGRGIGMQRLAPADQYRGLVTRGQADAVGGGTGDAGKAEQAAVGGADAGGHDAAAEQIATQKQSGAAQGARSDETTATQADQLFEVGGLVFF